MSHDGIPLNHITVTTTENICGVVNRTEPADNGFGNEDVFRGATREIVFGSIAGMVSEVFEYPFDLAKVRLQAQLLSPGPSDGLKFRGPMDCLMQTWKDEGVRGFYRGIAAPLAGSMAVTAALFLSYGSFQNVIQKTQRNPSSPLTMGQLGVAAAGAGAVASFVLTPIELVKCKMQVQMMNLAHPNAHSAAVPGRIPHRSPTPMASLDRKPPQPTPGTRSQVHNAACKVKVAPPISIVQPRAPPGAISLIRSIVATHGVQGLWLGHTGTLFRETGGSTAWFIVKEYVARALVERRTTGKSVLTKVDKQPLAWESALSGAMAGAAGAVILYPADTVKSAIQTEEEMRAGFGTKRKSGDSKRIGRSVVKGGFWRTAKKMYQVHGVRGLYAGCGMTVARAIPSSGIIFVVYDGLNNWWGE
ncbi:L-ornithine transporter [Coprinopsis sp. MPI-PUGE-AT-0042]|nr:L-ornithine transporter [Coprinopsis sp. MPI-PUGE-AT-0042]